MDQFRTFIYKIIPNQLKISISTTLCTYFLFFNPSFYSRIVIKHQQTLFESALYYKKRNNIY